MVPSSIARRWKSLAERGFCDFVETSLAVQNRLDRFNATACNREDGGRRIGKRSAGRP